MNRNLFDQLSAALAQDGSRRSVLRGAAVAAVAATAGRVSTSISAAEERKSRCLKNGKKCTSNAKCCSGYCYRGAGVCSKAS